MPKFGSLGITPGHGFNGSYVDVKVLIEHRVVLTILQIRAASVLYAGRPALYVAGKC